MRRETIGDATLYLGDCRDILPTLRPEVVVTDPVWPNCPAGLIPGSDDPWQLWRDFCALLPPSVHRLAVEMRNDSDPRFLAPVPAALPFLQMMWCQYVMPGYIGRVLGGNGTVYVFGRPIRRAPGRTVTPSVAPKAQPGDRLANGHPCSRALIHQEFVVYWCSDDDETVLDPFMGSGTTGVACARFGRRFVGIEVEPRYFDIACRRIEAATRQGCLLRKPPSDMQAALPLGAAP
jgi:hypothetical protein